MKVEAATVGLEGVDLMLVVDWQHTNYVAAGLLQCWRALLALESTVRVLAVPCVVKRLPSLSTQLHFPSNVKHAICTNESHLIYSFPYYILFPAVPLNHSIHTFIRLLLHFYSYKVPS